jgi:hypothetical protein
VARHWDPLYSVRGNGSVLLVTKCREVHPYGVSAVREVHPYGVSAVTVMTCQHPLLDETSSLGELSDHEFPRYVM